MVKPPAFDPAVEAAHTKATKARAGKRDRWLLRKWTLSRKGELHLAVSSRHFLVFQVATGQWSFNFDGGEATGRFATADLAKLGNAFSNSLATTSHERWPALGCISGIPERRR